ncbi:hypothetical protein M9H77_11851 [Catharanthus roseus]|uniref:Uncharacterized protein n=1 Tax=Catharanthus roseus TaxID=4058 RepID=A0ACC0BFW7_CATRO|nr:hypothetical protein M9H77_11851 [Catharanthus roseus]
MYIPSRGLLSPSYQNPLYGKFSSIPCPLNLMPNCMSVMESFQSSNHVVPDSTRSSIGEPEPISRNAPDCVVIPSIVEPLASLPIGHYVFSNLVYKIYRILGSL